MSVLTSASALESALSAPSPLTVLVFFRGSWCPFCQGYLKELDKTFRQQVTAAGGRMFGITAHSEAGARQAHDSWGVHYDVVSDPTNTFATRFDVAITPKQATPLAEDPAEYPTGMAQPAVVALDADGNVLYRWAIQPGEMNLGGATDRPLPVDIWAAIQARRDGRPAPDAGEERLDVAFLAKHYPAAHQQFQDWVASMS